ncbi:MAG: hypothetical protein R3337_04530 [Gammaproteobacteria bacterium]|nr:hypothetical protein [Gammaproteobacteria bacterium]
MDAKVTYDVILVFGAGPLALTVIIFAIATIWAWTSSKLNFMAAAYVLLSGLLPLAAAFYYYSDTQRPEVLLQLIIGILFVKLFEFAALDLIGFYFGRKKEISDRG